MCTPHNPVPGLDDRTPFVDTVICMAEALSRTAVARNGERIAEQYLRSLGYHIRSRNVRIGRGEIDLIAYDPFDGVVVFAEVKARSKCDPDFQPELNLTLAKKKRMQRASQAWVDARLFEGSYRLDFIGVENGCVSLHVRALGSEI